MRFVVWTIGRLRARLGAAERRVVELQAAAAKPEVGTGHLPQAMP